MGRHKVGRPAVLIALALSVVGCDAGLAVSDGQAGGAGVPAAGAAPAALDGLTDRELAPARHALLRRAQAIAAKVPRDPHHKTRARLQEDAALAALALGQWRLAADGAASIEGWRRGVIYAELAVALAGDGQAVAARHCVGRAREAHSAAVAVDDQEWRADRVLAGIARAELALGEAEAAQRLVPEVDPSELPAVAAAKVAELSSEDFDAQLDELRRQVATGDFNIVRGALVAAITLHDRFYDDEPRRGALEALITGSWKPVPLGAQLELVEALSRNAARRNDSARLGRFADLAVEVVGKVAWALEEHLPVEAQVARIENRAGRREAALARLGAALERFERERDKVFDVFRAGALRPLAEAYFEAGEPTAAMSVFRQAVEEGAANPNARPRAEDLVATCLALARAGLEPDAAMTERLAAIEKGLAAPW